MQRAMLCGVLSKRSHETRNRTCFLHGVPGGRRAPNACSGSATDRYGATGGI